MTAQSGNAIEWSRQLTEARVDYLVFLIVDTYVDILTKAEKRKPFDPYVTNSKKYSKNRPK